MCGIVAWAGKNPKKFNVGNFTSIGIQNEERGIDSCGVMIDGEIEIGIGETAKFRSFAAKVGIPQPEKIPVVIGHTRKTSVGTIHLRNAHPFGFGKTDLYPNRFIGVHNGTLYNMDDICGKFGVKERQTLKKGQWRKKIDSEMILESLYRSNSYQVLSEYYGLAALVFHDVNEPNVIYAYRGASVKRGGGADDTVYYERPLFYYQETRNSLYISSIKESLYSIGGTDDTVGEFL